MGKDAVFYMVSKMLDASRFLEDQTDYLAIIYNKMSGAQNWSIMKHDMVRMVHKGTADLSTKISLPQTVPVISPNARV